MARGEAGLLASVRGCFLGGDVYIGEMERVGMGLFLRGYCHG